MSELNVSEELMLLQRMKDYYQRGNTKPLAFRMEQLKTLQTLIKTHEAEIIEAHRLDLGRHAFETYAAEIGSVLSSISFAMKHLKQWMKTRKVKTPKYQVGSTSFVIPEPYGVALVIGAFNYPFHLCIEPLIGAISAGNCAVLKPSEQAPNVSKLIKALMVKGFPEEYIKVVEGDKEVITRLIHSPFDYIFFTGSIPVGKVIMEAAGKNLIPVTLELGGKSPCIVDEDANIGVAAERIVWGKFFNVGQTCIAPDYVLVHESIKKTFAESIKQKISDFYGKDILASKDYGRIINERHTSRLIQIINHDRKKIIFGGSFDVSKRYIEPTIMDEVTWEDQVMQDEIFGPILPLMTYHSIDQAIQMINQRPKPLALYAFTENKTIQKKILDRTSAGGCCINDTISHLSNHHLPFGGVGHSGMGAYHGKYSFETFSHMKGVLRKSTKIRMKMIFPPYRDSALKLLRKLLK